MLSLLLLFPFRKPRCGLGWCPGMCSGAGFCADPIDTEDPTCGTSSAPGPSPLCPAPPFTHFLLSLQRLSYQHPPPCSPRILGGLFKQLASFPNLPLPICCYQASSLLILLNFYLFPLGCLRQACVSLHMPKHLLLSALGWFLALSSCRRQRDAVPCFGRGTRGSY